MQTPYRFLSSLTLLRRAASLTIFAAATTAGLYAEPPAGVEAAPPKLDFQAALKSPIDLSGSESMSYSSSVGAAETASAENFFAESSDTQPPPRRRRYGRPNYSDHGHNPDGSNKLAFVVGVGFTNPVGDVTTKYLDLSWKFQGGVGYNFNKKLGVIAQFDWDNFGLPGRILANQKALYSSLFINSDGTPADFSGLDGHTHIWSITLNPTYTFYDADKFGAYAVVGGGFYHKVTDFTLPAIGTGYDYYYGYYQYAFNQVFDHYMSNSAGVNGGIGMTYKFGRFSSSKLFAEARYVHTFNNGRVGYNPVTGGGDPNNFYPGNASTSDYIPVTVGLRF